VLHIATVHYKSPVWIEIQTRHLREHISVPYETWASLERIDPSQSVHFDHVLEQRGPHAGKLNHLALEISHVARDEDLLMFLDGDAFPIADPMPVITDRLARAPLVAVRRAENGDEPQPHPCFCVTTVGTWRKLPGDWSIGAPWTELDGLITSDVGANLLRALELTNTPWVELLRTNGTELHPLFFAVYADIVYHHGAGFREGVLVTRTDRQQEVQRLKTSRIPVVRGMLHRRNLEQRRATRLATQDRVSEQSRAIVERLQRGEAILAVLADPAVRNPIIKEGAASA
jgi:hypothetical protein